MPHIWWKTKDIRENEEVRIIGIETLYFEIFRGTIVAQDKNAWI